MNTTDPTAALLQTLASTEPCPDCNADIEIRSVTDLVRVVAILHDPTCPALKRLAAGA